METQLWKGLISHVLRGQGDQHLRPPPVREVLCRLPRLHVSGPVGRIAQLCMSDHQVMSRLFLRILKTFPNYYYLKKCE